MKYLKKPLTLEQQADQLIARGLVADRQPLISRLRAVNYYRLTGYLYPYRVRDASNNPTDQFIAGTNLDAVWRRYNFDRRLRILLLDAIERIEVAVRSQFVYHFVHKHGPFGYLDAKNLPGFKKQPVWIRWWRNAKFLVKGKRIEQDDYAQWLGKLRREKSRASETFVKEYAKKYGDSHDYLPLWMACELMTCETALQFVKGVDRRIVQKVAADFNFPDEQLMSWTKAIFTLRNACAHHARIWNRVFGVKPSVPGKNKNPQWHIQPGFAPDRVGLMMTVCQYWLGNVSPTNQWKQRLFKLFNEYPEIPLTEMGLPLDWRNHPLWR
jgi:abortive infection bacteriophage resistance protein